MEPIAHSSNVAGRQQSLVSHARGVAELARTFGSHLGAAEAASLLGLTHDIGKLDPAFQTYLRRCEQEPSWRGHGPDHKGAGAALAVDRLGVAALAVQGHHGGLQSPAAFRAWIEQRRADPALAVAQDRARSLLPELRESSAAPPGWVEHDQLAAELFVRLLFSALVDADFLDTEGHFEPERASARGSSPMLDDLWLRFRSYHEQRFAIGRRQDPVARVRAEVFERCVMAADSPPGVFRLTVPTGGGKTLSALAFALRHAVRNGQRRVIVALPYLTITEQTAEAVRRALERPEDTAPVVLEHHSHVGSGEDGPEFDPSAERSRLAAENWDAAVVITTTVQLFESLFADGPSRCRKLHRIAGSVLILDEAQALPSHVLTPVLDVLRELVRHYGVTVVLSTATQPAFESIRAFAGVQATEIVPQPSRLFEQLRRVRYEWLDGMTCWEDVAALMHESPQALAIVNTKRDANALLDSLADPEALHLSTSLCGAHRSVVLRDVRQRLASGRSCRLVATQVVEAGVDIDFPLVLRAIGPLDSIVQAAGRCNREGRLPSGRMVVFEPREGTLPQGSYRTATDQARVFAGRGGADPDDPATARQYFESLYSLLDTDRARVQPLRRSLDFPGVRKAFRMLDTSQSVVVPYGSPSERNRVDRAVAGLSRGRADGRQLLRELQPYLVSVRPQQAQHWTERGLATAVAPGLYRWLGQYHHVRGLVPEEGPLDELVV